MFIMISSSLHVSLRLSLLSVLGGTRWPALVLSVVLSMCAMLSKEQGITVLGVCLIYDFFVLSQVTHIRNVTYNTY